MKFAVNASALSRELALAMGAVNKNSTIPILQTIKLETADSAIRITATDLDIALNTSVPAEVKQPGAVCIPAERLHKFVRGLPDGDIDVSVSDRHQVSLSCGSTKARIASEAVTSFPEMPEMPATLCEIPLAMLVRGFKRVMFAIAKEESRFTLNGALMQLNGALRLVATDGHRLALFESAFTGPDLKKLIPLRAMAQLVSLAPGAEGGASVAFACDDNGMFFRVGDRMLYSRSMTGSLPNYERILPKDQPHECTLAVADLRQAVKRVVEFSDKMSRALKVTVGNGRLAVAGEIEGSACEESIAVDGGAEMEARLNGSYIADFLAACTEDRAVMRWTRADQAFQFEPVGSQDNCRCVIMPMRY